MVARMSELQGRDLDVAIAEALGYSKHTPFSDCCVWSGETGTIYFHDPDTQPAGIPCWTPPRWHASLDALLRDVWPVLEAKGYTFELYPKDAMVYLDNGRPLVVFHPCGDTPAEAFAQACVAALNALREANHE